MLLICLIVVALTCAVSPVVARCMGRNAGWVLALPLLAAAAMAALLFTGAAPAAGDIAGPAVEQRLSWIPTLSVDLGLRLDGLSLVFTLLVTVIGALIMVYSTRYLDQGERHGSFYLLMTGFAVAMLTLVLADDLVVLYVAWEATTLCSFFLIARSGPHAHDPATRTLLVTVLGGLLLLAAVTIIIVATGTTNLTEALSHPVWTQNQTVTTAVAVLVALAAFTKSAQFPFQAWLPDSMVAITPVSAYLHAAAMVKAGIYLLMRFSPVFSDVDVWMALLIPVGLLTALFGAVAALRRFDLKELLAYSTMSQLGLIVAMIGVGTPAALQAAVVHTISHALFKSALFMLVGVIDHTAHTRDMRELADMRLKMPVTAAAMTAAAASMAGVPLLLGFISKEKMLTAFLEAPGGPWLAAGITTAAAVASVFTFAYSGRLVLGAFGGRGGGERVGEASPAFWAAPAIAATAGVVLGIAPSLLDDLASAGSSSVVGGAQDVHLALWHGLTPALFVSIAVLGTGTVLVLARRPLGRILAPLDFPIAGTDVLDRARYGLIGLGTRVGDLTRTSSPSRHLAIPLVCLSVFALYTAIRTGSLPERVGDASRPMDWALVALIAVGVISMMRARTLIAAITVTGVVGFAVTLWFFALGATDVAMTQLLVEILTVCVMVLLFRRLPRTFKASSGRGRILPLALAAAAGLATTWGVWALTGRRERSEVSEYFLTQGQAETGGSNLVNTILVDFRALDTLGELTVLGVAGLTVAAILRARQLIPERSAQIPDRSPLIDAQDNTVFVRVAGKVLGPIIVLMSGVLFFRGHYEPGGGFIAALVGGAGLALIYLSAPSDRKGALRGPYLLLIGLGIAIGVGTGLLGYLDGSFLRPLHPEILGVSLTTALLFDVGVYLAVLGVILGAFSLLGRSRTPEQEADGDASPAERPASPAPTTDDSDEVTSR